MSPAGPEPLPEQTRERPIEDLFPMLYDELRKLARHRLAGEPPGQTLQATALVHEAYLRLVEKSGNWKSRSYFFGAAAEAMRRILIDRARARQAARRGGSRVRVEFEELELPTPLPDESLLKLNAALERLAQLDPDKARLVNLKFFGGLTTEEAAEALEISEATAKRSWAFSRAWLAREMRRQALEPND